MSSYRKTSAFDAPQEFKSSADIVSWARLVTQQLNKELLAVERAGAGAGGTTVQILSSGGAPGGGGGGAGGSPLTIQDTGGGITVPNLTTLIIDTSKGLTLTGVGVGVASVSLSQNLLITGSPTFAGLTITGLVAGGVLKATLTSGIVALAAAGVDYQAPITFPLAIGSGGTGQTTAALARVALLPSLSGNTLKFLRVNAGESDVEWAASAGGGGTVTSVALSLPAEFTVSGSPVTTAGTLAGAWASQLIGVANQVWATADAAAGVPTFRALLNADLPTVGIAKGGTGQTTAALARVALLPSLSGNTLKHLRVNAAELDVEWAAGATIGGSIAVNQIAVGSGANTIAGSANLTFDGTSFILTGKAGFGGTPFAQVQYVLPNDATPNTVTDWDNRHVQWGTGGTRAPGLGISYTTSSGTVNMLFLEPSVAWRNASLIGGTFSFLVAGAYQAIYMRAVSTAPCVGINTTTPSATLAINGGLHVGGDSDPGDNNLIVDGKAGFGGIPSAKAQYVLDNDTAPSTITAWDNRHAQWGTGGSQAPGLGMSYSSGTGTVNMTFLEPNIAWRNVEFNAGTFSYKMSGTYQALYVRLVSTTPCHGFNTTTPSSVVSINGGLHVGGDTDAGDNNLLVDGTTTSTGNMLGSASLFVGASNLANVNSIEAYGTTAGQGKFVSRSELDSATAGGQLLLYHNRASGALVSSGDRLGMVVSATRDGSTDRSCGEVGFYASENHVTGTNFGGEIQFKTTPNGSATRVLRLTITNGGNLVCAQNLTAAGTIISNQTDGLQNVTTTEGQEMAVLLKRSGATHNNDIYLYMPGGSTDFRIYTGGSDMFVLTAAGNLTLAGSITTINPGSGAAAWQLGTVVTAAVTLDTAHYVEVKIGGTTVKLLKAA